jgi:hypothetical protein
VAVDHASTCSGDCSIVTDIAIHCDEIGFAANNLSVAATTTTTYVGATSVTDPTTAALTGHVFSVEAQGAHEMPLPNPLTWGEILLAAAPNGTVYVAGSDVRISQILDKSGQFSRYQYDGGVAVAELQGGAFKTSLLDMQCDGAHSLADLEIAPDGTPNLWSSLSLVSSTVLHETQKMGTWVPDGKPVPSGFEARSFFRTATDGALLQFGSNDYGEKPTQYFVVEGGKKVPFGAPYARAAQDIDGVLPLHAPPSPAAGIGRYAAVFFDPAGLHVAWEAKGSSVTVDVPGTAAPVYACALDGHSNTCGACHETGGGVEAFGAVRTNSGDVIVAYKVAHHDETFTPTADSPICPLDGPCYCHWDHAPGATTTDLVLQRVKQDGTVSDLTHVALPPAKDGDLCQDFGVCVDSQRLDGRAVGNEIAFAVPFGSRENRGIRVLRIHE